jgi:hypothetical protein
MNSQILRTDVLPKYNCSNCLHFQTKKEILETKSVGAYAVECSNVAHPLEDCVMRGFKAHSEQPSSSQTLNKNETKLVDFLVYCDNAGWIKNVNKEQIIADFQKSKY